jgi:hypothetical protein
MHWDLLQANARYRPIPEQNQGQNQNQRKTTNRSKTEEASTVESTTSRRPPFESKARSTNGTYNPEFLYIISADPRSGQCPKISSSGLQKQLLLRLLAHDTPLKRLTLRSAQVSIVQMIRSLRMIAPTSETDTPKMYIEMGIRLEIPSKEPIKTGGA